MYKLKHLIFCLGLLILVQLSWAQNVYYNPFLDPAVMSENKTASSFKSTYLWYPGQLSAHLQQKRLAESKARCVNVGYPGKFYAPVYKTYFKTEVDLQTSASLTWQATGGVNITVNGQTVNTSDNTIELEKGRSQILLEVNSNNDLPALKVMLNNKALVKNWKASLDGNNWNFAETSPVFGSNNNSPLDDAEVIAHIKPTEILPIRNTSVKNGEIHINKNGYVLIDFFHLEVGKVTFNVKGEGHLTAFVGETPEEALNENTASFEQFAIAPYKVSEKESTIVLPERAVRFVKLFCDEGCVVSDVNFEAKMWPVDFQMHFECSDERINNLWKASVASLHTSTHGFYLDGVKRDYLPWSMDAVVSTFAGDYLFSDKQVSLNSLSVALLPWQPTTADLGIPDYPLHALIGFHQFYKRYGDFNTILSYRERMEQLLALYETIMDERGFISANVGVSWGFVPGWATKRGPDRKGTPTYAQIMLYYNYKIGADFASKWGDKKRAKHYAQVAHKIKTNLIAHFWDEENGLFYNGYTKNGELDKGISHHAQYWAILADIFPKERYNNLFEVLPKIAYYRDYVSYEKGYEFLAYSKARKVAEMWDFLLAVFGDWLEQGHSRFPENFSYKKSKAEQLVFYRRPFGLSLCHGANGAPAVVAALNGIAGFSQSESNPNHYTLQPDLIHLDWANIEFPVKEGKIRLSLSKEGVSEIEIPEGCRVDVKLLNLPTRTFKHKGIYKL